MIRTAYQKDLLDGQGFGRLIPKVSQEYIDRSNFTRLKVQASARIVSDSMVKCLQARVGAGTESLQEYCKLFNDYFDVMNSGVWRKKWDVRDVRRQPVKDSKFILTAPITASTDKRLRQLLDVASFFEAWHADNERRHAASKKQRHARFITQVRS